MTSIRHRGDEWVDEFEGAVARGDRQAFAALFGADAMWRDLLAFTFNIRQFHGRDAMGDYLWGVTVNNVAPGTTLTPMVERAFPETAAQEQETKSSGVITTPVRLADADEMAAAVLYFCGPYSDHTTGTTIHVNGGSFMP